MWELQAPVEYKETNKKFFRTIYKQGDIQTGVRSLSITVEELEAAGLDEQLEAVETAVETHIEGTYSNVAVVSEPFAGREVFLDYAEEEFGAAAGRITFEEVVTGELPEFPVAEIVLVDNCHYLYTRQIGGFDVLETFLDRIVNRDALYVTSWNRYAWTYLSAVTDVQAAFPEQIQIPRLDANQVANLLTTHHGTPLPMFVEDEDSGRMRSVDVEWSEFSVGSDRTVSLPYPELHPEYVLSRVRTDAEFDIEAVVYRRIAQLSEGDPGVATILWDRSIRDGRIAPSYVQEFDKPIDIDHDQAFVLEVILTNERIAYDQLDRVCGEVAVDQALQALLTQEVISIDDDDRIQIDPVRLYSAVEHLAGRQLVW